MKKLLLICLSSLLIAPSQAQIVINEVILGGVTAVELKNLGASNVDVSSYQLCSFPTYNQIQNLSIVTGSLIVGPGELLVLSGHSYSITDDELGLYTSAPFNDSANLLDYVEWGSTGHTRSSVAVAAGQWATGQFVPGVVGAASIEYDGEGDEATDWLSTSNHTQGAENANSGNACDASAFVVGGQSVCNGSSATFQLILTGEGPWSFVYSHNGVVQETEIADSSPFPWMLSNPGVYNLISVTDQVCENDASGTVQVTEVPAPTASLSGMSEVCPSDADASLTVDLTGQGPYTISYQIDGVPQSDIQVAATPAIIPVSQEGSYNLVTVANNSCEGSVSGSVDVSYLPIDGGILTHGALISQLSVCSDDGQTDSTLFETSDALGSHGMLILSDDTGLYLEAFESMEIDFEGYAAGSYLLWHLAYEDGLILPEVGAQLPEALSGACFALSNPIGILAQTGMDCVSAIEDITQIQDLSLYPNPVLDQLNLSFYAKESLPILLEVYDLQGRLITQSSRVSQLGDNRLALEASELLPGAYLLSISDGQTLIGQVRFIK